VRVRDVYSHQHGRHAPPARGVYLRGSLREEPLRTTLEDSALRNESEARGCAVLFMAAAMAFLESVRASEKMVPGSALWLMAVAMAFLESRAVRRLSSMSSWGGDAHPSPAKAAALASEAACVMVAPRWGIASGDTAPPPLLAPQPILASCSMSTDHTR